MVKRKTKTSNRTRIAGGMAIWLLLMAIFICELLFYTWCRVQCTQLGYAISRATRVQQAHLAFQNNLKIERVRLQSPQRIAGIAKNQLGLIVPRPDQVIILP